MIRNPLILHGEIITAPIPPGAQLAFDTWMNAHMDELTALFAEHGVDPRDIETPTLRMLIRDPETATDATT